MNIICKASRLSHEYHLKSLPLLFVSSLIKKEACCGILRFASPNVALKAAYHYHVQPIKRRFTKVTIIDVICKHALALSIGWSLSKCARTRYIALADVEPVARNFPLWNNHASHCRCE
jgi:hypothetical protein